MKRASTILFRGVFAIAAILLVSLVISGRAYAQDEILFDVKAVSAVDGLIEEFPLDYTILYDNGEKQQITINREGVSEFRAPLGVGMVEGLIFRNIFYSVHSQRVLCLPRQNGGCWCLCLQWVNYFPLRFPRWFWYYNPCC